MENHIVNPPGSHFEERAWNPAVAVKSDFSALEWVEYLSAEQLHTLEESLEDIGAVLIY